MSNVQERLGLACSNNFITQSEVKHNLINFENPDLKLGSRNDKILKSDEAVSLLLPQLINGIKSIARKIYNVRTGPEERNEVGDTKLHRQKHRQKHRSKENHKVLLEWEASEPSLLLKLEVATTSSLMEELLVATAAWEAERLSLEGVTLLRLVIGVVTSVKSGLELWVGKNFVGLVNLGHLLLRFLRTGTLLCSLVRVVLDGEFTISLLDLSFVCVSVDTKNLVVVFLF